MASTLDTASPPRRALGDLDVNTQPSRAGLVGQKNTSNSPSKPDKMAEISSTVSYPKDLQKENDIEAWPSNRKRSSPMDQTTSTDLSNKRPRMLSETSISPGEAPSTIETMSLLGNSQTPGEDGAGVIGAHSIGKTIQPFDMDLQILSSPSSSVVSPNDDINDSSQPTIVTEPDESSLAAPTTTSISFDSFLPSPPKRLSREEIREKAQQMKLRLRLANYKVKTNQENVPLSRLQVRPSGFSPSLSAPARLAQPQLPLPKLTSIPNINLESPSSEDHLDLPPPNHPLNSPSKAQEEDEVEEEEEDVEINIPSSPPPYKSPRNLISNSISPMKEPTTPLPRPLMEQEHQSFRAPPRLGSPIWKDMDVSMTSSIVKESVVGENSQASLMGGRQ